MERCLNYKMTDFKIATLEQFLNILGLENKEDFYLLDPELYRLKVWVFKRLLKYTNDSTIFHETIERINQLQSPLENYVAVENQPKTTK